MPQGRLPDFLAAHSPVVERALRASLELPADPNLPPYRMMRYQLGWTDQMGEEIPPQQPRLLGALCIEAHNSLSANSATRAATAAAAIELFRESTRVHEDMQTAAQRRAGQDAIWWIWGPAQAINIGDGLHAIALYTLIQAQDTLGVPAALAAAAALDAAALQCYEGHFLDLQMQERVDISEAEYLRMARCKHGSLLGGALALGAVCAGAPPNAVEAWRNLGSAIGVGALISAEARVFWGDPDDGHAERALNKSKLYPVVAAFAQGSVALKRELGAYYFKRVIEPDDLHAIRSILDNAGARDKTNQAIAAAQLDTLNSLQTAARLDSGAMRRWETTISALVSQP